MGKALFESNATFREWMLALDSAAAALCGESVVQALYGPAPGRDAVFDRTLLTHPAIFMVEYSLAQALIRAGVTPQLTWGASVGSFAAAAVAGFLDVRDALCMVVQQARSLESHCPRGGMVSILAEPLLFGEGFLRDHSELAGVNFESHFVVSALESDLPAIVGELRRRALPHQQLPVSFAFHSRWIDAARASFACHSRSYEHRKPGMPMMCCERAALLEQLPAGYFWDVARRPMRFATAAAQLERGGAYRYIDVGPAGTLAALLKRGLRATSASKVFNIMTPFARDAENFAAIAADNVAARGN
jgi:acyl transferase domain-containing protein